jgi:hypothetical protein
VQRQDRAQRHENRDGQPDAVGSPPPPLAIAQRGEDQRTPAADGPARSADGPHGHRPLPYGHGRRKARRPASRATGRPHVARPPAGSIATMAPRSLLRQPVIGPSRARSLRKVTSRVMALRA